MMAKSKGVLILKVHPHSPAAEAGLREGERLIAINGFAVNDALDSFFHGAEEQLLLSVADATGAVREARAQKSFDQDLGLELEDFQVRRCNNECVFCFIHQNPPNLRKSIYFKDGDFRMSFLHGNYITTTNLSQADLDRIVAQRLSPLYISVHATDDALRRRMLGVKKSPPILERLRFFAGNGIHMHTQIVLCPEWNDAENLEKTVRDLAGLGPQLLSIAVVPLGMTERREGLPRLKPVTPKIAREILGQGRALQRELEEMRGEPLLFFSDEWHLLAEEPWPDYSGVEILHQLENGVGMLHTLYCGFEEFVQTLPDAAPSPRRVAVLTGRLGIRALAQALEQLNRIEGLEIEAIALANSLFGDGITVSGLLSGRDFARGIRENRQFDLYLIPDNALHPELGVFLDDIALDDLRKMAAGRTLRVLENSAVELARAALAPLESLQKAVT